ncbi:hypothetical protein GIB67_003395 [Kingdonia uniflora]|uniref:Uncharacterized protein n=1 Tax=Kingdonia uniflora TaxID=39325 RepID=A0A7J7P8Z7_9MAGN|nr:hypothetical protein GIB67_003395 [Kingdonia uniflora]
MATTNNVISFEEFEPGVILSIKTTLEDEFVSMIMAFDRPSGMVALIDNEGSEGSSSRSRNMRILTVNCIVEFRILGQREVPRINLKAIRERAESVVRKAQRDADMVGNHGGIAVAAGGGGQHINCPPPRGTQRVEPMDAPVRGRGAKSWRGAKLGGRAAQSRRRGGGGFESMTHTNQGSSGGAPTVLRGTQWIEHRGHGAGISGEPGVPLANKEETDSATSRKEEKDGETEGDGGIVAPVVNDQDILDDLPEREAAEEAERVNAGVMGNTQSIFDYMAEMQLNVYLDIKNVFIFEVACDFVTPSLRS